MSASFGEVSLLNVFQENTILGNSNHHLLSSLFLKVYPAYYYYILITKTLLMKDEFNYRNHIVFQNLFLF